MLNLSRCEEHQDSFTDFSYFNHQIECSSIDPPKYRFALCSLIHAYAVGRDMDEALLCVKKMRDEEIEMSLVTYSIIVGGFARVGNVE